MAKEVVTQLKVIYEFVPLKWIQCQSILHRRPALECGAHQGQLVVNPDHIFFQYICHRCSAQLKQI